VSVAGCNPSGLHDGQNRERTRADRVLVAYEIPDVLHSGLDKVTVGKQCAGSKQKSECAAQRARRTGVRTGGLAAENSYLVSCRFWDR